MKSVTRVARPPEKPLLIFDGDCTFCRRWIARWKQTTGERVEYLPQQSDTIVAGYPELSAKALQAAVHLIEPDGRVTRAAEAVFRTVAPEHPAPLWLYENIPGCAPACELAYRVVASNRTFFSWLTRAIWGRGDTC